MNGLLESIVRRRRASASGNGSSPPVARVNGSAAAPASEASQPESAPGFLERGRLRRRARFLRQMREVQLRELGGFLVELHRFRQQRPELLQAKIAEAAATDSELRALDRALGAEESLRELRQAGVGGSCRNCGAIYGTSDRFCAACGQALAEDPISA